MITALFMTVWSIRHYLQLYNRYVIPLGHTSIWTTVMSCQSLSSPMHQHTLMQIQCKVKRKIHSQIALDQYRLVGTSTSQWVSSSRAFDVVFNCIDPKGNYRQGDLSQHRSILSYQLHPILDSIEKNKGIFWHPIGFIGLASVYLSLVFHLI